MNCLRSPYDSLANTQPDDMDMQKLVNKVQTEWHRRSDPHQSSKKKVNEVQDDSEEVNECTYNDNGDMVEAVKKPHRNNSASASNKRGGSRNGKYCNYCKIPGHNVKECRTKKAKQQQGQQQQGGSQGQQQQQQGRPKQVLNPPLDPVIAKMISSCSINESAKDFQ